MNDEMAMKQRGGTKGKTRCWENAERFWSHPPRPATTPTHVPPPQTNSWLPYCNSFYQWTQDVCSTLMENKFESD